jgi:ribosomal protein S7
VAGKARQVGGFSWWSARDVTEEEKDRKKFAIRWSVLKAKRRDGVKRFMQERVFNKDPYLVVSCSLKNILKLFKNIIEN